MGWRSRARELGARRTKCRFLWWPKTIGGETRWLEHAEWEQVWAEYLSWDCGPGAPALGPITRVGWRDVKWVW